jgi:3-oxoacyl-[acyl-carrier protein] reductase
MKTGRIVLITGAAGGMGSEFVSRFLGNGDTVVATDLPDALDKLRQQHSNSHLRTFPADLASEAECLKLAEFVKTTGRVDVLINCAGYFPITPFESTSVAEWRKIIDVNLTSMFLLVRLILPLMKGHGWGRIINIGSASVFEGVPEQVPYVAAKAGVLGLTRSLAREIGSEGITVNVVAPGLTLTPPVKENIPARIVESQVESRAIKRDEIAKDLVGAVFFLSSPDADFISGQTITVDGGRHMQ